MDTYSLTGYVLIGIIASTVILVFLIQFFSDKERKQKKDIYETIAQDLKIPNNSRDFEKVIKNVSKEIEFDIKF